MANREITDHMDRLPRDVAQERMHDDIVRLLDEHCPRPPQHHHLMGTYIYFYIFPILLKIYQLQISMFLAKVNSFKKFDFNGM